LSETSSSFEIERNRSGRSDDAGVRFAVDVVGQVLIDRPRVDESFHVAPDIQTDFFMVTFSSARGSGHLGLIRGQVNVETGCCVVVPDHALRGNDHYVSRGVPVRFAYRAAVQPA
jgi:hypothetical protein